MPARVSEAIVLRTYPLKESDVIASFFTRDQGKLRGVAKRARRPKSAFGAGLERLSQVRMFYFQKETHELVNLDSCELVHSQFGLLSDFAASVALDYMAEVSEQMLPAGEPNEKYFRLLTSVLEHLRDSGLAGLWRVVTYFSLWAVRLAGLLPALDACLTCGAWLDDPEKPQRSYFSRAGAGLVCANCRTADSWELSIASRALARQMLKKPIGELTPANWDKDTGGDLRHYLVQRIEDAIERRLVTAPMLENC